MFCVQQQSRVVILKIGKKHTSKEWVHKNNDALLTTEEVQLHSCSAFLPHWVIKGKTKFLPAQI